MCKKRAENPQLKSEVESYIYHTGSKNPYGLGFDRDWVNYLYEETKMTLWKWIFAIFAIAPSFTKVWLLGPTTLIIKRCFIQNSDDPKDLLQFPLSECFEFNKNSLKMDVKPLSVLSSQGQWDLITIQIIAITPHLYFFMTYYLFRKRRKVHMWLKGARITFHSAQKRWETCRLWCGLIGIVLLHFVVSIFVVYTTSGYVLAQDLGAKYYTNLFYKNKPFVIEFEMPSSDNVTMSFLSTFMVYSCIIMTLKNVIQEPMTFYYGFKKFCKTSSRVDYNVNSIDYRVEKNEATKCFFSYCETNDCYVVLIAYVTYLLDKGLLEPIDNKGKKKKYPNVKVDQGRLKN